MKAPRPNTATLIRVRSIPIDLGGQLVLAQRLDGAADPRVAHLEARAAGLARRRRSRRQAWCSLRDPAEAGRRAGRLEVQEEDANDLAEAHRHDEQVDALDPKRGEDRPAAGSAAARPPISSASGNGTQSRW